MEPTGLVGYFRDCIRTVILHVEVRSVPISTLLAMGMKLPKKHAALTPGFITIIPYQKKQTHFRCLTSQKVVFSKDPFLLSDLKIV